MKIIFNGKKPASKICVVCGKEFTGHANKKTCSFFCSDALSARPARREKNRKKSTSISRWTDN